MFRIPNSSQDHKVSSIAPSEGIYAVTLEHNPSSVMSNPKFLTQATFSQPLSPRQIIDHSVTPTTTKQKRHANVYDAVAGRVSSTGFIPEFPFASKNRDTLSSSHVPVPPEEVLFRRKRAPTRYEEHDYYFASDELRSDQQLPNSDLLKAIHTYASDFYARATKDGGKRDWHSMDGTALIAVGILLEEAAKETLGETGAMVFVEGEEDEGKGDKTLRKAGKVQQASESLKRERSVLAVDEAKVRSGLTRRNKRRKVDVETDTGDD
ncbi:MAG: hypothetical protein M1827_000655 [Pycnora praestabilis]|nr:MAG: hypothetical protein M1827_000655 [Pycnora praestabilis]